MTSCQELSEEEKKKNVINFSFNDKNNVDTLIDEPSNDVIHKNLLQKKVLKEEQAILMDITQM